MRINPGSAGVSPASRVFAGQRPALPGFKPSRRTFLATLGVAIGSAKLSLGKLAAAVDSSAMSARAQKADRLIASQVDSGEISAAALLVRQGSFEFARGYGLAKVTTPFLIASPTKPMTASAVMWLHERQQLDVADPVQRFLPAFRGERRGEVTIKHLLTHTSGLPDMLPENLELRRQHAPLSEFVARTCRTPLLFPPGEKVSYQSMGILLAAAIVEKVAAQPLPAFLASNIFRPLAMNATSLGLGGRPLAEMAQCQVPAAERGDWDWNSAYWRNLGAPWGGVHSTVHDLARFAEAFVSPGAAPWSQETRRAMRTVQTGSLRPAYGYGWRLERGSFGQNCSPATFGHHGSTGTVVWHDPDSRVTCVVLTTKPASDSRATVLGPVSDVVSGG